MRYVIAIGGNAISDDKMLGKISKIIVKLAVQGNEIVVTHGNGPQVGRLALHERKSLALLTKETEKQIGEEIKRKIISSARKTNGPKVNIVFTRVLVDPEDPEFNNPTKPIGEFYANGKAKALVRKGFVIKRLINGFRRVVPSPKPQKIIDIGQITRLLSANSIVIAAGGGGIPMFKKGKKLIYAEAVIDKDFASSLLAMQLHADKLILLTNVPGVFLNFKTKKQKMLRRIRIGALKNLIKKDQFEAGSMLPKVQACINFVEKTGKEAAIGSLSDPGIVLNPRNATKILP